MEPNLSDESSAHIDEALTKAQDAFAQLLAARGIGVDDIRSDIEPHKGEICESLYGVTEA